MGHSCAFMMVTPLCRALSRDRSPYAHRTGTGHVRDAYGLGFEVGFGIVCFGCGVGFGSSLWVGFGLPSGV